jgi:hypothetical protein
MLPQAYSAPADLAGVTAIAVGFSHSLALKGDGTVVAWGNLEFGGNAPVPSGLAGVTAIAAGTVHNLALVGLACSVGQFDNGSGCVNAAPGHYVSVAGATEQTPCDVGYYQPNAGADSGIEQIDDLVNTRKSCTCLDTTPYISGATTAILHHRCNV